MGFYKNETGVTTSGEGTSTSTETDGPTYDSG